MQDTDLSKPVVVSLVILLSIFVGIWYTGIRDDDLARQIGTLPKGKLLSIEGVKVYAEIADTKEEWEKGLSGRESLAPQRAMLFVFPHSDYYSIWMKGMKFPIDVFWIDENGYIVDIWHHAMPDDSISPQVYTPSRKAKYVLETAADFADEHNIEIGDRVYKLPK